jgi:hypothetical protein
MLSQVERGETSPTLTVATRLGPEKPFAVGPLVSGAGGSETRVTRCSRRHRPGAKDVWIMPGLDCQPVVAETAQPIGRAALRLVVVAKDGKAVVIQYAGEVGDIGAKNQVADAHRLMARSVSRREEKVDRAVAQ